MEIKRFGHVTSIDPGLRACGVATWFNHKLISACLVTNPSDSWRSMVDAVDLFGHLVIEQPQVYNRAHWKGDPDDLIQLAGLVGAFVYACQHEHTIYKPAAWKGSVTKAITEMRVRKRLTAEELAQVELPAKGLRHNVWDGVGIGLRFLER